MTALTAVAALLFTARSLSYTAEATRATSDQLRLNERGLVTDLFGRAVDQLGSPTVDIRLGGIYALERLMHDSPADRNTVIEVLSAFIRTHSSRPATVPAVIPRSPVDVTAAFVVLARRGPAPAGAAEPHINLTGTLLAMPGVDVPNARLARVDLTGADLRGARLYGADLKDANLENANLRDAQLSAASRFPGAPPDFEHDRANLSLAKLNGADLSGTNLADADLSLADMRGAKLRGAFLARANLSSTDLEGADLRGARLADADLGMAYLDHADLRGANLNNAKDLFGGQLQTAILDEGTALPTGMAKPTLTPTPGPTPT